MEPIKNKEDLIDFYETLLLSIINKNNGTYSFSFDELKKDGLIKWIIDYHNKIISLYKDN